MPKLAEVGRGDVAAGGVPGCSRVFQVGEKRSSRVLRYLCGGVPSVPSVPGGKSGYMDIIIIVYNQ